ncbi:ATP-binding protein [Patescibacteria group bacterium]|nr:ATP-binding protein [Patescibacteria group bacterium]MBU4346926.1 ATP-binding protein [Patescibacteria group bacterium]MBU4455658.1 ATP-binding protein [Patescibacteria group bacterium]MCG2690730.1 ATP-binding protein [Candidatus Parcubacteria bacterium]MDP3043272.1 ATP-binding protein [bacterium]
MYKRIFKINRNANQSFFLFGPRGTGKTTWLKSNFQNSIYLDLLDSKLYRTFLANPEKLEHFIPADYKDWVILDEVQKAPNLLNEVHRLIEAKKYKFILTGSSARGLRKKGINLLAGRALTYYFHPLTQKELGKDFSLQRSLKFGQLPMACTSSNPDKFLNSYIQTYLKEEVLQEGLTRNIGNFSRFLETAAFSQGEILNASHIARESQLERKTVENYFSILEDLLIGIRVPVFNKRSKRKLISHNKFYYFDVGIFRSLRPRGPLDSESEIDGAALETLFLQEIRALNDYYNLGYKIYYWRSATGLEVDFALYGPKGLLAFEIKRKSSIFKKDLKGLRAFSQDYPEAKLFVFCSTDKKEYHGDIQVLPIETALKNLKEILLQE